MNGLEYFAWNGFQEKSTEWIPIGDTFYLGKQIQFKLAIEQGEQSLEGIDERLESVEEKLEKIEGSVNSNMKSIRIHLKDIYIKAGLDIKNIAKANSGAHRDTIFGGAANPQIEQLRAQAMQA